MPEHASHVPFQELVTIRTGGKELTADVLDRAAETVEQHGMTILETGVSDLFGAVAQLDALQARFGSQIGNLHLESEGRVTTTGDVQIPLKGQQSPHTLGAFGEVAPNIALHIVIPAKKGGEGIFVDGKKIYDYMLGSHPKELQTLYDQDAMQFALGKDAVAKHPVFRRNPDLRLQILYSKQENNNVYPGPGKERGFAMVKAFVENPANWTTIQPSPGQLIVVDNARMLQGRKGVKDATGQSFVRGKFDNNPPGKLGLRLGIPLLSPS